MVFQLNIKKVVCVLIINTLGSNNVHIIDILLFSDINKHKKMAKRDDYTMLEDSEEEDNVEMPINDREKARNLVAFFLLGFCNNFAYVVMLSAAFDILSPKKDDHHEKEKEEFHCNPASTGVILLADILPCLILKLTAPYFMQAINYHIRVIFVIATAASSFLFVAFATNTGVAVVGVICASISSGFGEITYLSLTSHFKKTTVSLWSSGTGAAGVGGALAYAGLTSAGLSPRNTVLLMLIVPATMGLAFWVLLKLPHSISLTRRSYDGDTTPILTSSVQDGTAGLTVTEKMKLIPPLLKFMIPLFVVYLVEYTINQGLYELLYFKVAWLSQAEQYRWFQVDYQVGVLISRSSANIFRIKRIFIPTVIQCCIFIVLLFEVMYGYMNYIWIALVIVFLEGLCGGAVYVNAFYNISEQVEKEYLEFSMGAASVADSFGITISSLISIPIHTALCAFKLKRM